MFYKARFWVNEWKEVPLTSQYLELHLILAGAITVLFLGYCP